MARIVLADDGIEFDGRTLDESPLGGAESSLVSLMETLAARGHAVSVHNNCRAATDHNGVQWRPLKDGVPDKADLYIANRSDRVLPLMPEAGRTVFWTHNPCGYMLKWRYLSKLWRHASAIVFIGDYHATTWPGWAPGGERVLIPYGLPDAFCEAEPTTNVPGPRAVFTSNPLRGLDWLLERWERDIQPRAPGGELHLFTGAAVYGSAGDRKAQKMAKVLDKAKALAEKGVRLRGPVPKQQLIDEFRQARCMLYRGDINETFCHAVGEAQAMGVPAVVTDLGSMAERVADGCTGAVALTDAAFAENAVRVLTDETVWQRMHLAALETQRSWRWADAAATWERLIP
ncbi:MAG: glycosyltransferase family 4 protein [Rhodospirillaceae bacterium]